MTRPALEVTGLRKIYGGRAVVDDLNVQVSIGTVLALLGPNGAGKSTTVEICEGFRRADGGTVRVLGLDPKDRTLRPRVGVMPQTGGAYPGLRCGEMLHLVASYAAHPLDPGDLLDRLGLREVERTHFRRLSGGQQQRLSLALAVVGRPELVFLDEPTAGLDPQARRATWELIRALRADGVTVLLTTHLLDEAEQLADDVVIIDHGRVVAAGTVAELTQVEAGGQLRFLSRPGLDLDQLLLALPEGCAAKESPSGSYLVEGPHGAADRPAAAGHRHRMVRRLRGDGAGASHRDPQPRGRLLRAHRKAVALMSSAQTQAWEAGALTPAPGAAPIAAMLRAQTLAELKLVLRNGEQVLLSLVIPLGLVVLLVTVPFISLDRADGERPDFFVPGVLALAIMSSAFTGQAIAVGFERQYGVLKRLGATPLPRAVLLGGKTLAVLVVEVLQVALLCGVGLALGWNAHRARRCRSRLARRRRDRGVFSGLGLLLGGTMRGLTTLAAANLLWFLLLVLGGVLFPHLGLRPGAGRAVAAADGGAVDGAARRCCRTAGVPVREVLVLAVWSALGLAERRQPRSSAGSSRSTDHNKDAAAAAKRPRPAHRLALQDRARTVVSIPSPNTTSRSLRQSESPMAVSRRRAARPRPATVPVAGLGPPSRTSQVSAASVGAGGTRRAGDARRARWRTSRSRRCRWTTSTPDERLQLAGDRQRQPDLVAGALRGWGAPDVDLVERAQLLSVVGPGRHGGARLHLPTSRATGRPGDSRDRLRCLDRQPDASTPGAAGEIAEHRLLVQVLRGRSATSPSCPTTTTTSSGANRKRGRSPALDQRRQDRRTSSITGRQSPIACSATAPAALDGGARPRPECDAPSR